MKPRAPTEIGKPKLSRMEARGDATTRAARAILDAEAQADKKKTARLRAARLAREAQQSAAVSK